jgi:hypothetical protein
VLRVSILPGKRGPLQLIRKRRAAALQFQLDDPGPGPEAMTARIEELIKTPFDLVTGPLYRVEIVRRSPNEHTMVLVIHHAIADGWTLGAFMSDLWTAYAMLVLGVPGGLEPVAQSYAEWGDAERAFWQADVVRARQPFWIDRMAGAARMFSAPEIALAEAGKRRRWSAEIPGELVGSVRKLANRLGATLFSTVLTAFQLVLTRNTGKEDILVGSPVAQRSKRAVWGTMGSFAGIVPLRGRVNPEWTFAEQLDRTLQMSVDSFAQALPFGELVKCLGEEVQPGKNPIFDVRFALQNHPMPEIATPELQVDYRTHSTGTSRFDLACELTEIGPIIEAVWLFREDMFSSSDMERMHRQFTTVLSMACDDSEASVATLIDRLP